MKKQSRKLNLNRETLRHLEAVRGGQQAAAVQSGVPRCVASNYLTTCCQVSQACATHTPECYTD